MSKSRINLNGGSTGGSGNEEEIGTLIIVVLKAKNLNDRHFRKQDVYASVTLNGVTKKTETEIKGGQAPVWDAEIRFPILKGTTAKYRNLEVACYSQEPRPKTDEILGKGIIDLAETLKTGEFDDWVELELEKVQRGDVYMEMTFFSNGPAPVKQHSVSLSPSPAPAHNKQLSNLLSAEPSSLHRRPSKLSPADRLARPGQGAAHGPSRLGMTGMPGGYPASAHHPMSPGRGLPASLQPSYSNGKISPTRDTLPPLPNHTNGAASTALPAFLRPGAGGARPGGSPAPNANAPQQAYGMGRHPSTSPPASQFLENPYIGGPSTPSAASNPYIGGGGGGATTPPQVPGPSAASNPYLSSQPQHQPQQHQPQQHQSQSYNQNPGQNQNYQTPTPVWRNDNHNAPVIDPGIQGAGGFAFPVPQASPIQENYGGGGGYPGYQGGYGFPSNPVLRDGADPSLMARYSTPLPLPPGASRTPAPAPAPAPVPAPAPAPTPAAAAPSYQNYAFASSPPKVSTPGPDNARMSALRRAEEDAKRRYEQEQKDMELALMLDRELNL